MRSIYTVYEIYYTLKGDTKPRSNGSYGSKHDALYGLRWLRWREHDLTSDTIIEHNVATGERSTISYTDEQVANAV